MSRSVVHFVAASLVGCALALNSSMLWAASVAEFGAKGDGRTDDSAAFAAALASGKADIYVPPGNYLLGPKPLNVPKNVFLHGAGRASTIIAAQGTKQLLTLGPSNRLEKLHFEAAAVKQGGIGDGFISLADPADDVSIDSVGFANCDRACIYADHADDLSVSNCDFRKVGVAVSLIFSNGAKVTNNTVVDARLHGIQFWGNWKNEKKESHDLIFANNRVKNGGGGAIWGTGAVRVVLNGNIVDGAEDVGLDLEWCEDSVISGNTVRNCRNGGISLFFACQRISITGNTVANDRPISKEDAKAAWWARAGIWLTDPNRAAFATDRGHRDITIVGNTVWCSDGPRRAIWIGRESENITIEGNTLRGGKVERN